MVRKDVYGVYFIFKSMEQGPTFRVTVPKYPTKDPNHRIFATSSAANNVVLPLRLLISHYFR
jgi:hypothetical protein